MPHTAAIKAMTTVWNNAKAVAEATARVPEKTPVTITRCWEMFRCWGTGS